MGAHPTADTGQPSVATWLGGVAAAAPNSGWRSGDWSREEIVETPGRELPTTWQDLTIRASAYRLPEGRLPLSPERLPFSGLSEQAVEQACNDALTQPQKTGRLTDSVREILGFKRVEPKRFFIFESHIDLTNASTDLASALVGLGFEPDGFAQIYPPQYVRHFTLEFVVAKDEPDRRRFFDRIQQCAAEAAKLIEVEEGVDGYVETETYDDGYFVRYAPFVLEDPIAPLDELPFSTTEVPLDDEGPSWRRAADIHLKVATKYGQLPSPVEKELRRCLCRSGFYEIVTHAGNVLYTGHFSNMAESNWTFRLLDAHARQSGVVTSLAREVCNSLWRKRSQVEGRHRWAEVPPHLSLAARAIQELRRW